MAEDAIPAVAHDFVFTWDGKDYWFDDLLISEIEELEALLGVSWGEMAPIWRTKHGHMIAAVFLRRSLTEEEVADVFANTRAKKLRDAWTRRPSDLPDMYEDGVPKAGAEVPTPGS